MAYFRAAFCSFLLGIAISISCSSTFHIAEASRRGFSVELIHRDSPRSPFYDPKETPSQRLVNAFRRSVQRLGHFYPSAVESTDSPQTRVTNDGGEYLMKVSFGTPPFDIVAIADTGSDLIWSQCRPCTNCYKQDDPLFNPNSSTTYRDFTCRSKQCSYLDQSFCSSSNICQYQYQYGDQSYTNGNLAADTVTLGSTNGRPISFPKTIIGCGHDNSGTFDAKGSGIIGLGGGQLSLIRQLDSSISGKFSYCLVPLTSQSKNYSSKLNFGNNAVVSGNGVVSTPLSTGTPNTFYYLTLEAISVGDKKIPYRSSSSGSSDGNIIIDSGTTLTLIPQDFFSALSSEVDKVAGGKQTQDPNGVFQLCYTSDSQLNIPILTAHFKGADVKLNQGTIFIEAAEGVDCFAFIPTDISVGSIFGNLAQSNLLVGYDLQAMTLSFKPTDCTMV
ncbi:hypothetical protein K2173_009669 [Erythroxylum novogranatense]|uniref:Peptidase A1 domain-containing protein n=1 Tax=Erythroxylum novogranatense TaxID=1862640 RepID=A0AAV8U4T1_9ROSI|nr:hypothetical protein K2173_009669 [Erythroxylum novogranatense]